MEIVDELFTPGCPQCAVKHLSAALAHGARAYALHGGECFPSEEEVLLAQAYINLGEVLIGYKSHLWYAVGLLQASEETALAHANPGVAAAARDSRLHLEMHGLDGVAFTVENIRLNVPLMPGELRNAHLREATRELPNFEWGKFNLHDAQGVAGAIEEIRSEYFSDPTVGPESEEPTNSTGDQTMATAKKAACKGGACSPKKGGKATKCACKGGKTKKGK